MKKKSKKSVATKKPARKPAVKKTRTAARRGKPAVRKIKPVRRKAKTAESGKKAKTRPRKKEFEEFRALLIKLRDRVREQIESIERDVLDKTPTEAAGDLSDYAFHMADMATDNYERDFSTEVVSSNQELLYIINEALKKIEDGVYGVCDSCGRQIRKKRLRAIPYAIHCIDCQGKEEKAPRGA